MLTFLLNLSFKKAFSVEAAVLHAKLKKSVLGYIGFCFFVMRCSVFIKLFLQSTRHVLQFAMGKINHMCRKVSLLFGLFCAGIH